MSFKTARLQDCMTARLHDCKTARLQDCKTIVALNKSPGNTVYMLNNHLNP